MKFTIWLTQSHVAVSFKNPEYTSNVNALGTLRLLESGFTKINYLKLSFIKQVPQNYLEIQNIKFL